MGALRGGLVAFAILLSGCLVPDDGDPALHAGAEAPPIPNLRMEGATVVERNATAVTFRWSGHLPPPSRVPFTSVQVVDDVLRIPFEVPQGPQFRARAVATVEGGASFVVALRDAAEVDRCVGWPQVGASFARCGFAWAGPAEGPWELLLVPGEDVRRETPVTVELAIATLSASEARGSPRSSTRPTRRTLRGGRRSSTRRLRRGGGPSRRASASRR